LPEEDRARHASRMNGIDGDGSTDRRLVRELRARIEREGPITFAAFMEAALYHPDEGFYARPAIGETGHFVTSPHVSPVFGILVASQVEEFWELLERPDPFLVVEAGAGDGTLARQILESLSSSAQGAARYVAVDRSEAARAALQAAGIEAVSSLEEVGAGSAACLLANELLDNVPFHRVRRTYRGLVELFVAINDRGFELVEGPLSSPELAERTPDLPLGAEWPVRPGATAFLDQARIVIARGYVWIADYALDPARQTASVHGYRGQALEEDVLDDPGSRDITAGVDFEALRRHALAWGAPVWGPVSQREALLALGFRDLDRRAQARQQEAIAARRGIDAMRIYSNRTRANMLVAKGGLGDFLVLCVGLGIDLPPRSLRASVW
jgi:SAM-dependent MidA family methyltransferase